MNSIHHIGELQKRLDLNDREMAAELRISPEWYSKLKNAHRKLSADILLRASELSRRNQLELGSITPGESKTPVNYRDPGNHEHSTLRESPTEYGKVVASRITPGPRSPSTRADVEAYLCLLIEAAESSGDPNVWPVIHDRLKKHVPISEFEPLPE